jgi:N6-adenosine-specific RNA methylase IME4
MTRKTKTKTRASIDPSSPIASPLDGVEKDKVKVIDLRELGSFEVILADPAWQYSKPKAVYQHSQIENKYKTMPIEEIKAMRVPRAKNGCLYLWCPPALFPWGLEVMRAWGYKYITHQTWEKIADRPGLGYYFQMEHEDLLFGKRGRFPAPPPRTRPKSVIHAKTREHSRKPDCVYDQIERQYPTQSKIELFARNGRSGWASWGNETEKYKADTLTKYVNASPEKKNRATALDEYVPKPARKPGRKRLTGTAAA